MQKPLSRAQKNRCTMNSQSRGNEVRVNTKEEIKNPKDYSYWCVIYAKEISRLVPFRAYEFGAAFCRSSCCDFIDIPLLSLAQLCSVIQNVTFVYNISHIFQMAAFILPKAKSRWSILNGEST